MIAIKDFKMPRGCYECPFADESIRMDCDYYCQAAKDKPDVQYGLNKPDWCPLVDVPDINVGKCSEIPNNSDCVSRRAVIEKLKREFNETDVPDRYPGVFDAIEEWLSERELPSAQPEIILCKDCIHRWHSGGRSVAGKWIRIYRCKRHGIEINLNDFCSYAERKKDG